MRSRKCCGRCCEAGVSARTWGITPCELLREVFLRISFLTGADLALPFGDAPVEFLLVLALLIPSRPAGDDRVDHRDKRKKEEQEPRRSEQVVHPRSPPQPWDGVTNR